MEHVAWHGFSTFLCLADFLGLAECQPSPAQPAQLAQPNQLNQLLSVYCRCAVDVLSLYCLCTVAVLSMYCRCTVAVLSVLSMYCRCTVAVLSLYCRERNPDRASASTLARLKPGFSTFLGLASFQNAWRMSHGATARYKHHTKTIQKQYKPNTVRIHVLFLLNLEPGAWIMAWV